MIDEAVAVRTRHGSAADRFPAPAVLAGGRRWSLLLVNVVHRRASSGSSIRDGHLYGSLIDILRSTARR